MPFTPIHMGPGILIKSLLQGSFSLMVFGWSQIVMDIQPLFVMITGEGHLHGFSHTFVGATLLAIAAALSGKYLSEIGLYLLLRDREAWGVIGWPVAFFSAFTGAFSHVVLDGIMHADVQPFFPVASNNPFLGLLTIDALHGACLISGAVGGIVYFGLQILRGEFRFSKPLKLD
ncbi:hypothetical protein LPB19_16620 [Marinobacter salinisoli]|uniref:Hydrolase n=1 Tax=Marinobacter salinisoli TaxID=2769486 RepID=A0ABX7MR12_9GAMM|nr:metal-dependent hydrolase [Marinobacter salinisoli]QSP94770.1 hypothetical protein LPB19_16620 [Marinobacter salinisoli]